MLKIKNEICYYEFIYSIYESPPEVVLMLFSAGGVNA